MSIKIDKTAEMLQEKMGVSSQKADKLLADYLNSGIRWKPNSDAEERAEFLTDMISEMEGE